MNEVETIMQMLQQYFGKSALLVLALFAVIHWTKESKNRKKYLICVILMLVLLLNDFVFHLIKIAGEEDTYYRLLWIIPITLFAAYFVIELWSELSGYKRVGSAVIMGVFLWIYTVPSWTTWGNIPSNIYQLDDEVIEVADIIENHSCGKRVNIIDDYTVSWHIREYNDNLCDPGADDYDLLLIIHEKYLEYTKEQLEDAVVAAQMDYVILPKEKEKANALLSCYEFDLIGSSEHYNIYYMNRKAILERKQNEV